MWWAAVVEGVSRLTQCFCVHINPVQTGPFLDSMHPAIKRGELPMTGIDGTEVLASMEELLRERGEPNTWTVRAVDERSHTIGPTLQSASV